MPSIINTAEAQNTAISLSDKLASGVSASTNTIATTGITENNASFILSKKCSLNFHNLT